MNNLLPKSVCTLYICRKISALSWVSALFLRTKTVTQTLKDIQYSMFPRIFYIYSSLVNARHWVFNKHPLSICRKYYQLDGVRVVFC
jgi:hypothetical protein